MTRDDDPTQPLPTATSPDAPGEATPTEPLIAPHVPVADVGTAEMTTMAPAPVPPRSGARRIIVVGLSAVAAAVIAVVLLSTLPRGETPAPVDSSSPPATPSPSVSEETVDDGTDPAPPPPPVEPAPEPTPTTEPTVEPTPAPTP